jgi:hypothetical protein
MNCPKCGQEMKSGELDLKARGVGWAPQAQLHIDERLLAKDQYLPVISFLREGKKFTAHHCATCRECASSIKGALGSSAPVQDRWLQNHVSFVTRRASRTPAGRPSR